MDKSGPVDSQILDIVQVISVSLTNLIITVDRIDDNLTEMDQLLAKMNQRLVKVENRLDEVEKHTKLIPGMAQAKRL